MQHKQSTASWVGFNAMNLHCGLLRIDTMLEARDTMMSKMDTVPAFLALPFQGGGRQVTEPSQHSEETTW